MIAGSDEKAATPPATRVLQWVVTVIAVAMSLYHMYVAAFGPPEAMIFRGTHLIFALTLVFLLYPFRAEGGAAWRVLDFALLVTGWGLVLNIFLNYQAFTNRIIYIDELTAADKFWAVVSVIVVLEATRRVIGWALPLTAIAFLAYAIGFTHVTMQALTEQVYLSLEGIFGSTLGVSASYVILFVLFGAFMEHRRCLPAEWLKQVENPPKGWDPKMWHARSVADYIASMTDRLAILEHKELFDAYRVIR